MNTLPRRTRRRLPQPGAIFVDQWETKRQNEHNAYQQAAQNNQPGSYRIRPKLKNPVNPAAIADVAPTLAAAATAAALVITLAPHEALPTVGLLSAGCGISVMLPKATRRATSGRQNNRANHNDGGQTNGQTVERGQQ